jgi:sialate O-acetylesterase
VLLFFAKDVSEKNKVPVGIIHSSLGGSPIQAWMDENSLKNILNIWKKQKNGRMMI